MNFGVCLSPTDEIWGVSLSRTREICGVSKPCRSLFRVCLTRAGQLFGSSYALPVKFAVVLRPTGENWEVNVLGLICPTGEIWGLSKPWRSFLEVCISLRVKLRVSPSRTCACEVCGLSKPCR